MARFSTFSRDLQLATADMEPSAINGALARFAKDELAKAIAAGEASSIYTRYVNGREGAPEESVQAPGPIVYDFSYWQPIIAFALDFLQKRSPVLTGRYGSTHVVMLGSQVVNPTAEIGAGEEVQIVNTQPYARKIEVGHMLMSMPDGVYQDALRAVRSQFGRVIDVRFRMVLIPGGYTLKGVFRRGYKPGARTKLKRDTQAGARMTYPSLQMRMR
jgi:hypothetical protein